MSLSPLMNTRRRATHSLVAIALFVAPSQGQIMRTVAENGGGPLDGLPFGWSAEAETLGITNGASIHFKREGFPPVLSYPPEAAHLHHLDGRHIALSEFSMFRSRKQHTFCTVNANHPNSPDIDALSVGLDWIEVDRHGYLNDLPPGAWAGFLFSVTKRTITIDPDDNVIGEQALYGSNGASGDVFSYFWPTSTLPQEILDQPLLTVDASEYQETNLFWHGGNVWATSGRASELDALDMFIAMSRLRRSLLHLNHPNELRIYFSVASRDVHLIPDYWLRSTDQAHTRSGATIFELEVDIAHSTLRWKCPRVKFTPGNLGLSPSEDIDAFAFDEQREMVAFSTRSPHRDPLLVLSLKHDLDGAPKVLRKRDGTPVSRRLRLGGTPDDVDGICFDDPRSPSHALDRSADWSTGHVGRWLHRGPEHEHEDVPRSRSRTRVPVEGSAHGIRQRLRRDAQHARVAASRRLFDGGSEFHPPVRLGWRRSGVQRRRKPRALPDVAGPDGAEPLLPNRRCRGRVRAEHDRSVCK